MQESVSQIPTTALRLAAFGLCLLTLTGCQGMSTLSSFARVRIVNLSVDAPPVDVYRGSSAVAYNLSFGTVTSYIPVTPGSFTLTVDVANSKQVLASVKGHFAAGSQYTMLVNSSAASLQQVVLTDQPPSQLAGSPSIRLVHEAVQAGPVDVYLVPAGHRLSAMTPIVTNLTPGTTTNYLAVPAGVSAVVMLPAGYRQTPELRCTPAARSDTPTALPAH